MDEIKIVACTVVTPSECVTHIPAVTQTQPSSRALPELGMALAQSLVPIVACTVVTPQECVTHTCSNTKSTRLTCITGAWDGPGAEPCAPLSDSVKGHGVFIVCVHPEVLGASRLCRTAYSRLIRVHAR